jgi:hypothetical protein
MAHRASRHRERCSVSGHLTELLLSLAGAPALPGAKCRGRSHLFDDATPGESDDVVAQRHLQALGLCERCPALFRCQDWFDELTPSQRPEGVVAGQVRRRRVRGRPKSTAS